ncbi:MAG: methyltransferase domain-containing protein [candidate division KSB1 bacterium]|nr:methyltransferase domain-containing protein [candidate division KSB1 bacterium]MDZ7317912.1 methyltransferase domain-containing protein [candidate division KSB1 bacterium]MDZ7339880.1 methyltransferase domain-containing protein [candidate division KSB1 bacterium]
MMRQITAQWYLELFEKLGRNYLAYPFTRGTVQEVDFMVQLLQLTAGQRILDVGCGPGRHAIELARRGLLVTGLDFSPRMIALACEQAAAAGVEVEFVHGDARTVQFPLYYDAAFSLCEGAFGIMNSDVENTAILTNMYASLKSHGKLLLNVLNASYIFRHPEQDSYFDPKTCMGYWTEKIINENGQPEELHCSNRYYTFSEIKLILETIGFDVIDGYGCQAGNFQRRGIELDDFEILVYAQKP